MEHCHEISTPFWPGKKRKRKALSLNAGILFQLHISKGMAETTVHCAAPDYALFSILNKNQL